MRALRSLAWGIALATVCLVVVHVLQVVGAIGERPDDTPLWIEAFIALAALTPAIVGALIATHKPRIAIAWILLLGGLVTVVAESAERGVMPLNLLVGDGWALQIGRASMLLLFAWPIAVAYVFPDGRLLSRRWRWVVAAAVLSFAGVTVLGLAEPTPFHSPVRNPVADNVFGEWVQRTGVAIPFFAGSLASLVAAAVAIRLRLRRSTGVTRLQTLWLAWALLLIPLGLPLCLAWKLVIPELDIGGVVYAFQLFTLSGVAVAVGVAVARYRLYAIDRLLNRTLVYAILTALLLGAYAGITLTLGVALGTSSSWVTAAATLAVALAFRPLRALAQNAVDRRFSRARYDALRRVWAFEEHVREGRRAPEEIAEVLGEALADPLAQLLFWLPASEAYADSTGEIAEARSDGRARSDIHREGARTAVLLHDPALLDRPDLLKSVLSAATLSIEIARLRVEVRLQLAEVQASRARIVEATYDERRRLERDLHDGAQQRLVSLGLRLRRMQRALPREAGILSPAFDQIVGEIGHAISDLRQIAAGVRPARLDDGLAAALRDLAQTAPVPVDVDASVERVAASVEAAAYYVACEALTNAVKHASASRVEVRAVRDNGALVVTVSDDGVGGAVARRGSGLAGLHDRVAAHGGTLTVVSPNGQGTRVEVTIPCES